MENKYLIDSKKFTILFLAVQVAGFVFGINCFTVAQADSLE
jgi:hypothetical protein